MPGRTSLIFTLLLTVGSAAQAQTTAPPPHSHLVYDVVREGTKIGTFTTDIDRQGDATTIKMSSAIDVKMVFVTVYRFGSSSTENWKAGQFLGYESKVDDNGTKTTISAKVMPDKVVLDVDGKASDNPRNLVPASMWNRDFLKRPDVFDPDNGKRLTLKVADAGDETLSIGGVTHRTHHYKIVGDFARELWFDGETMVRLKIIGSDKSVIISDLRPA